MTDKVTTYRPVAVKGLILCFLSVLKICRLSLLSEIVKKI